MCKVNANVFAAVGAVCMLGKAIRYYLPRMETVAFKNRYYVVGKNGSMRLCQQDYEDFKDFGVRRTHSSPSLHPTPHILTIN